MNKITQPVHQKNQMIINTIDYNFVFQKIVVKNNHFIATKMAKKQKK